MDIYILRHGETNWNAKGIIQGRSQNRLSKNGIEQVKIRANENKNLDFDLIISSPLMRTIQTANIFNSFHNKKIIKDDRIIEIDQGIFTGRKKNTLTEDENNLKCLRSKKCDMETYEDIIIRVKSFLIDLKKNYQNKKIVIVTHRGIAKTLYALIQDENATKDYINSLDLFENAELKHLVI